MSPLHYIVSRPVLLALVLLSLAFAHANAQETCTVYKVAYAWETAPFEPTREAACTAAAARLQANNVGSSVAGTVLSGGVYCSIQGTNNVGAFIDVAYTFITDEQMCSPTGCAASAGTTKEVNFTLGWTRTANADDYGFVGGQTPIPTSACHGGCTVGILTAQRTWVSPTPSPNGLYRHSADLLVIGTDSECSTTTPAMEPTTENADCDGTVGYVNGKRTCVKGSSAPDPVSPAPAPEKIGNPSAGSEPNPTDNDNPAGREPTGGNGGNDGGPPSGDAAGDPRGTGTGPATGGAGGSQTIKVEIPDLKDPCGIPGSPPCKIDETGTPTDPELDPAQAAEDAVAAAREFAENPTSALPAHPDLNWTFALPTGCSAITIEGFGDFISSIDVCPWQDLFHELMSIVWIMGGLFGAISHFFRNVYSQG